VVPDNLHDFFVACAGVAGALVGLLFVAMAALGAFVNALVVSLVALLPGDGLGSAVLVVAVVGLLLVGASLLSLLRAHQLRGRDKRESSFLIGLVTVFGVQLAEAVVLLAQPADQQPVGAIAVLVLVCFMVGIGRSWELVGAPSVTALVRPRSDDARD
jgi:hypothetical protein